MKEKEFIAKEDIKTGSFVVRLWKRYCRLGNCSDRPIPPYLAIEDAKKGDICHVVEVPIYEKNSWDIKRFVKELAPKKK